MVSRKVVISNPTGLHLRPAGLFCKAAAEFCCSVKFRTDKGISSATVSYTHLTLPTN